MHDSKDSWDRLIEAARQAPEPAMPEAPFGFATRVVARWQSAPPPTLLSVWELLARRILVGACAVMLLSLALHLSVPQRAASDPIAAAENLIEFAVLE
ncbi:MAG: hypothetical protein AB1705_15670 [Verrucomicrobiota bacterium]